MENSSRAQERRSGQRQKQKVQIRLNDHQIRSKNICSGGVYFEVMKEDINKFSLGKTFALEITISSAESGLPDRTVRLTGLGVIIRTDMDTGERDLNECGTKFGVALKFKKKLKIESVSL